VTAAFAAAASLGLEYTVPEVCQTLILTRAAGRTPVPEAESLESLASHGASLAIYLSAGQAAEVGRALGRAFGPGAAVCVSHRVSWPDQRLLWTTADRLERDLQAAGVTRQALILAGPAVNEAAPGGERAGTRSRLYHPGFSHGYRGGPDQ
jgi:precorrin-4/cobalt-precorrin-4 C11-methyltransferase